MEVKWLGLSESAAGVPSVMKNLSVEPCFTRKRRMDGVSVSQSQLKRDGVLIQHNNNKEEESKTNRAMSFRGGERRSGPAPVPSEYQVQFTWKHRGPTNSTPLLLADQMRSNGRGSRKNGGVGDGRGGGRQAGGVGGGGGGRVGGVGAGGGGGRGGGEGGGNVGVGGGRRSAGGGGGGKIGRGGGTSEVDGAIKERKKNSVDFKHHHNQQQKEEEREEEEKEKKKERKQKLRKQRLNQKKIVSTGQTEYRRQFKAWPISPRSSDPSTRLREVGSPRKKSDITDHRLITPSPLPHLPEPLVSIWGTEYSTRFRSPLDFQYVSGAWVETPQPPSPTPTPIDRDRVTALRRSTPRTNGGITSTCPDKTGDEEVEVEEVVNGQSALSKDSLTAQLSEIRDKAEEYRQRSEGCHFLPTHSSWQQHPNNDRDSTLNNARRGTTPIGAHSDSFSVSSLSYDEEEEESDVEDNTILRNDGDITLQNIEDEEEEEVRGGGREEEEIEECSSSDSEDEKHFTNNRRSNTLAYKSTHRTQKPAQTRREVGSLSSSTREGGQVGRVPTQILKSSEGGVFRHHLDRTTPCSGAVLTSPLLPPPPPPPTSLKSSRGPTVSATTSSSHRMTREKKNLTSLDKQRGSNRELSVERGSTSYRRGGQRGILRSQRAEEVKNLSQTSARLRRDPSSLLSSRHTSHSHSLPKTAPAAARFSQSSRRVVSQQSHGRQSQQSIHTSPLPPRRHPPSPPSITSSLLHSSSSTNNAASARNGATTTSGRKFVTTSTTRSQQFAAFRPQSSHTSGCCTTGQCDICGAWLRRSTGNVTGAQGSNPPPSNHASPPRASVPLGPHGTRKYRGPVTKLSERLENRDTTQPSQNQNHPYRQSLTSHRTPLGSTSVNRQSQLQGPPLATPTSITTPPHPLRLDDDELSVSSLSLSCCSTASDLLKKSQQRREHFWTHTS